MFLVTSYFALRAVTSYKNFGVMFARTFRPAEFAIWLLVQYTFVMRKKLFGMTKPKIRH